MTRQLCFDTYVHIMHSYVVHRCAAISSVLYDGSHCMACGLEYMLSVFCASYLGKVCIWYTVHCACEGIYVLEYECVIL